MPSVILLVHEHSPPAERWVRVARSLGWEAAIAPTRERALSALEIVAFDAVLVSLSLREPALDVAQDLRVKLAGRAVPIIGLWRAPTLPRVMPPFDGWLNAEGDAGALRAVLEPASRDA